MSEQPLVTDEEIERLFGRACQDEVDRVDEHGGFSSQQTTYRRFASAIAALAAERQRQADADLVRHGDIDEYPCGTPDHLAPCGHDLEQEVRLCAAAAILRKESQ